MSYRWPKQLNKRACAYATVHYDKLRYYNCLDAVYTYENCMWLIERIEEENLETSAMLRHVAHQWLFRSEQRGVLLDVKANREASKKLDLIIEDCERQLTNLIYKNKKVRYLAEDFNPGSNQQVSELLYGPVKSVPAINRRKLMRYFENDDELVNQLSDAAEAEVYGDYTRVKKLLNNEMFDAVSACDKLQQAFDAQTDADIVLQFEDKPLGLGGLGYDPPALTKAGAPSVSRPSLLILQKTHSSPIIELILMRNKAVKMKTSFIDKIYNCRDKWDLVRTSINPHGTQSGRLSSSGNFNIQNLQKNIRPMFIPRPGMIFAGLDYKSAEVFTLAAYADDPELLKAIYASDTHRYVASIIYGIKPEEVNKFQRQVGKTSVFLICYGGGADRLAAAVSSTGEKMTKAKAQWVIDTLLAKFPGIKRFLEDSIEQASQSPYYTYTAFGTRRSTIDILSSDLGIANHTQRIAGNHTIQGSAGEMCIYKIEHMINKAHEDLVWDTLVADSPVYLINTVHDSKLFETWPTFADRKDPVEIFDKDDKTKVVERTWTYFGPFVDIMEAVVAEPVPFPPVDKVTYKADIQVEPMWEAGVSECLSIEEALSDRNKGGFNFDLLPNLDTYSYGGKLVVKVNGKDAKMDAEEEDVFNEDRESLKEVMRLK